MKIGQTVTAKQTDSDGEIKYITGKVVIITENDLVYMEKKWPRREQYCVKASDIIIKGEDNEW